MTSKQFSLCEDSQVNSGGQMISASSTIVLVSPSGYNVFTSFMSTIVSFSGPPLMKLPYIVVSNPVSPFSFRIVVYL